MKRFIIILVSLFAGFAVTGYCQTDQVSFIHGLGENTTVWNTMAGQLQNEFEFIRDDVGYNSGISINSSASSVFIPYGTVAVGHSLGGVLAREYLRQRSPGNMKGLITVGSPHLGAPVAEKYRMARRLKYLANG